MDTPHGQARLYHVPHHLVRHLGVCVGATVVDRDLRHSEPIHLVFRKRDAVIWTRLHETEPKMFEAQSDINRLIHVRGGQPADAIDLDVPGFVL
jgi:hypothetical protein